MSTFGSVAIVEVQMPRKFSVSFGKFVELFACLRERRGGNCVGRNCCKCDNFIGDDPDDLDVHQ